MKYTRRFAGVLACAFLASAIAGCKNHDQASKKAQQAAKDSGKITQEEDDLLSRRDALLKLREQLHQRRAQLAKKRHQIEAQGGDTSQIDKESSDLFNREGKLVQKEAQLNQKYEQIVKQRRGMLQALAAAASGGSKDTNVAAREAAVASREKDVARREAALSQREAALSRREAALAKRQQAFAIRQKNVCGQSKVIETVAAPKGANYSRRDVEPVLKRARRRMSRRGILRSDLPAPAKGLEREAARAMRHGDYAQARFAAEQLLATVRSMHINREFISDKIERLNQDIKGVKLSAAQRTQVDSLFRQATAEYGDGKLARANGRLNRIYAIIH